MIQFRALRLPLLNRIWTISNCGICWLHRCTDRREPSHHEVITHCTTFPVNRQLFQVRVVYQAATKVCDLIHGICLVHRETFLAVHVLSSIRHRHLIKECFIHSGNRSATDGNPVRPSAGRPVSRSEEQNRDTVPTPRFVRRPSTMNSFLPVEGQSYMADQERHLISELQF